MAMARTLIWLWKREEVEGRGTNPWVSYLAQSPRFVTDKLIIPIIQTGLTKDAHLPDVPLARDLARRPEDQPILDFFSKAVAVGRPVATTPGTPADRIAALRKAFDETLADPDFRAEADRQKLELEPVTGMEIQDLVLRVSRTPPDVIQKFRDVVMPPF